MVPNFRRFVREEKCDLKEEELNGGSKESSILTTNDGSQKSRSTQQIKLKVC